ncbi:MAG: response regulator transcription factor [Rubrivivax sp.]|nr:response regulator transcription factor [Rubrivivax sp.]
MSDSDSLPKALVVDDHAIARLGVRHLLARRLDVAEAAGIDQALAWLADHHCALILLDLNLGDQFGLAALPRLRARAPRAKVVVLSSLAEDLYAERALRAGADGYVMKSALGETLLEAVDAVLAGQVYVSPAVRSGLLRRATGGATDDGRPAVSPRELEVLRLIAAGKSTREIADTLNRSVKTVETHKQSLKVKLGADTPAQLLRLAIGWFEQQA